MVGSEESPYIEPEVTVLRGFDKLDPHTQRMVTSMLGNLGVTAERVSAGDIIDELQAVPDQGPKERSYETPIRSRYLDYYNFVEFADSLGEDAADINGGWKLLMTVAAEDEKIKETLEKDWSPELARINRPLLPEGMFRRREPLQSDMSDAPDDYDVNIGQLANLVHTVQRNASRYGRAKALEMAFGSHEILPASWIVLMDFSEVAIHGKYVKSQLSARQPEVPKAPKQALLIEYAAGLVLERFADKHYLARAVWPTWRCLLALDKENADNPDVPPYIARRTGKKSRETLDTNLLPGLIEQIEAAQAEYGEVDGVEKVLNMQEVLGGHYKASSAQDVLALLRTCVEFPGARFVPKAEASTAVTKRSKEPKQPRPTVLSQETIEGILDDPDVDYVSEYIAQTDAQVFVDVNDPTVIESTPKASASRAKSAPPVVQETVVTDDEEEYDDDDYEPRTLYATLSKATEYAQSKHVAATVPEAAWKTLLRTHEDEIFADLTPELRDEIARAADFMGVPRPQIPKSALPHANKALDVVGLAKAFRGAKIQTEAANFMCRFAAHELGVSLDDITSGRAYDFWKHLYENED